MANSASSNAQVGKSIAQIVVPDDQEKEFMDAIKKPVGEGGLKKWHEDVTSVYPAHTIGEKIDKFLSRFGRER